MQTAVWVQSLPGIPDIFRLVLMLIVITLMKRCSRIIPFVYQYRARPVSESMQLNKLKGL